MPSENSSKTRKLTQAEAVCEVEFMLAALQFKKQIRVEHSMLGRVAVIRSSGEACSWYESGDGADIMERLFACGMVQEGYYELYGPQANLPEHLRGDI